MPCQPPAIARGANPLHAGATFSPTPADAARPAGDHAALPLKPSSPRPAIPADAKRLIRNPGARLAVRSTELAL
jgi:hypothetical protein